MSNAGTARSRRRAVQDGFRDKKVWVDLDAGSPIVGAGSVQHEEALSPAGSQASPIDVEALDDGKGNGRTGKRHPVVVVDLELGADQEGCDYAGTAFCHRSGNKRRRIKSLKDQYFVELSDLYNKISVKLQHVDSIIPPQKPSEQYERMKSFKIMLDRMLQMLQVNKGRIQPAWRDKIPQYEKQIVSILNSQKRKPVQQTQAQQQFQPPPGQAPNSNISQQQQPSQSLQQHDSHINPQSSLSSMSTGLQSSGAAGIQHVPAPPATNFSVPATQQNGANIPQAGSNRVQ